MLQVMFFAGSMLAEGAIWIRNRLFLSWKQNGTGWSKPSPLFVVPWDAVQPPALAGAGGDVGV
jgi:hypothetical protein